MQARLGDMPDATPGSTDMTSFLAFVVSIVPPSKINKHQPGCQLPSHITILRHEQRPCRHGRLSSLPQPKKSVYCAPILVYNLAGKQKIKLSDDLSEPEG